MSKFEGMTAKPVPFSSIVGQSIAIHRENGAAYCQLHIIGLPVATDYKAESGEVAQWIAGLINKEAGA